MFLSLLIHELFYTIWPVLFAIGITPVLLFFFSLNALFYLSGMIYEFPPSDYWILDVFFTLFMAFMISLSFLFLEQAAVWLYSRLRKATVSISLRGWLKIWLGQFLVIILLRIIFDPFFDLVDIGWPPTGLALLYPFIVFLGYVSFIWYLLVLTTKGVEIVVEKRTKISPKIKKGITVVTGLLAVYVFYSALIGVTWFFVDENPQASRFFTINAAIKNTCFIDPERANCPQTLEEISYIEPKEYQKMIDCCQVNYQYSPIENKYSLVVRYSPTQAVLFDWRLVDEIGVDLKEYQVSLLGQDGLINPPSWDGPWTFPDWSY